MKIIVAIALVIVLSIVVFLLYIGSGIYNVAARKPHNEIVSKILHTAMERSVKRHARGIVKPPRSDDSLIKSGFKHYNEMCVGCHGKPGLSVSEIDNGFNPAAPDLIEEIKEGEWSAEELFWITKNGIKMSAMPSFGHNHSDEEIWAIVAFLESLPNITPEEYKTMEKAAQGKHHEQDHENEHEEKQIHTH